MNQDGRFVLPRRIADDDDFTYMDSPAWMGPPRHHSAGSLVLDTEIGRSHSTVILINTFRVYEESIVRRLTLRFADRVLRVV